MAGDLGVFLNLASALSSGSGRVHKDFMGSIVYGVRRVSYRKLFFREASGKKCHRSRASRLCYCHVSSSLQVLEGRTATSQASGKRRQRADPAPCITLTLRTK